VSGSAFREVCRVALCLLFSEDFILSILRHWPAAPEKVYKIISMSYVFPMTFRRRHNMVLILRAAVSIIRCSLIWSSTWVWVLLRILNSSENFVFVSPVLMLEKNNKSEHYGGWQRDFLIIHYVQFVVMIFFKLPIWLLASLKLLPSLYWKLKWRQWFGLNTKMYHPPLIKTPLMTAHSSEITSNIR